jgi:RNA recognition motif-containing protein
MKKMYVGNLPFSVTEDQLRQVFAEYGTVESAAVITDRTTGQPRGFGFVEMSEGDADKAMRGLNGKDMGGRSLTVNEARAREGGGGGGGFRGNDRGGRTPRW